MDVSGDAGLRWPAVRIVFRADASVQIGTGHVMRCLSLADELTRHGHECRFVCRKHEGHLGELIASKGYGLTLLPSSARDKRRTEQDSPEHYALWLGVPWQEDARQTLEAVTPLRPEWLVVDHYALDAQWERAVASATGNILVIDDLANRAHDCVMLLDQNLGRSESDYDGLVSGKCQRLIGPRYALLRSEFAEYREQSLNRRQNPELKRILISLGGVDRANVTGEVLEMLAESKLPHTTELDIIMGAAAPHLSDVRQQATQLPYKTTVSVSVNDMARRMCLADLSIGAAGGTSWERCCLGLPAVLVILAENQVSGARALQAAGAACVIADIPELTKMLPPALNDLATGEALRRASQSAANITDGLGVKRITKAMLRSSESD